MSKIISFLCGALLAVLIVYFGVVLFAFGLKTGNIFLAGIGNALMLSPVLIPLGMLAGSRREKDK